MSEEVTEIKLMRHLKGQPEPPKKPRRPIKGAGRKKKKVNPKLEEIRQEFLKYSKGDFVDITTISQMIPALGVRTIRYYAQRNRMPFRMAKIGGVWFALKSEVEKYIKSLYDELKQPTETEQGGNQQPGT